MSPIMLDLKSAVRSLARTPWFTALAILILSLGIGLNSALFSIVDAVLLRSLPFRDADRLVEIWGQTDERAGIRVPEPFVDALRTRARTIEMIGVHDPIGGVLGTAEGPIDIRGQRVSSNFVELMGVPPQAGRGFRPDEGNPGAAPVALVGHNFWQRYLGGDPAALGRSLTLDSTAYTIVGIMPPSFRTGFHGRIATDYWTPHANERTRARERELGYELVARLASGATLADARREVAAIGAGIAWPDWGPGGRRLGLVALKNEVLGASADALLWLFAAVALVLVMVCANLALLQLARSDRQIADFATRKAMGAPAAQLFRLALIESVLVAAAGGIGGVALAYGLMPILLALAPAEIPRIAESAVDGRVLTAALGLTLLTGCGFGLVPALRLSRLTIADAMKRSSAKFSARSSWFRSGLVAGQVALSVTLCVTAGLVIRTFVTLLPSDPGFDTDRLTVFFVDVSAGKYPDPADRRRRLNELVQWVESHPGVSGAALATNIPFSGDEFMMPVGRFTAERRVVSSRFFELLGMPILRGRPFAPSDVAGSTRVAVVNQTLATRLAPTGDVIGRSVRAGNATPQVEYTIIGVVRDARSTGAATDIWNEFYVPYAQASQDYGYLVVRSTLPAPAVTELIRRAQRAVAPGDPVRPWLEAQTLESLLQSSLAGPRFSAALVSTFSLTALLLAALGVFGMVAHSVSQRRQELGIRAALGARPSDLGLTAVRPVLLLAGAGLVCGLGGAAWVTRFIEKQLYGVAPLDIPTFAGAALVMSGVAALAAAIPARRAMRTDPVSVLRLG